MKKKMMNNEKMNQIIDEVYKNYLKGGDIKWLNQEEVDTLIGKMNIPIPYTKEEFINKCKTDTEFLEKWGLKIEEREVLNQVDQTNPILRGSTALYPHKLITLTYNNKTIESHE